MAASVVNKAAWVLGLLVSLVIYGSARHSHCRGQGVDSPMLHQIMKCRTRIRKWKVRTSDKLKGQLVKLSFKYTWDNARGFIALAETARMTLTGTLFMSWIRSLIHWHTRINSTLEMRLFFRKSKTNILNMSSFYVKSRLPEFFMFSNLLILHISDFFTTSNPLEINAHSFYELCTFGVRILAISSDNSTFFSS